VIAISYRREDTAAITGRIYDRLQAIFSRDRVFMDLDSIPFGVDFRHTSPNRWTAAILCLLSLGPHWLGVAPDGSRRIDDPTDFVRLEVAQALARNIRVIPLLIARTEMPSGNSLPEDLKTLAFRGSSTLTVSGFPPVCATQKPHSPSQNAWSQAASESTLIVSNLSGHSGNFQIGM